MIDRYKRKLVLVSVTVIFVVIATIIAGINVSNSIKISNNADIIVNILLENDGKFPENASELVIGKNEEGDIYLNPEVPFSSRYFTVEVDNQGNVMAINCDNVVAINEQTAVEKYEKIKRVRQALLVTIDMAKR